MMPRPGGRTGKLAVVVIGVGLLAACGKTTTTRARGAPSPSVPATSTAPAAASASCGDPTASLRPPAVMPTPGNMPAGSYMRTIQDRGSLVAGTSQDQLLFGSLNSFTGQIEGFDVDVLREVVKAIFGDPSHLELKPVTSAERIPKLQDGSVDIVARTMTINCARRQQVDFSSVYFQAGQRVLVQTDSTATGIQDLGGKKVCVAKGTTSLDNVADAPSHPVVYPVANQSDCLVAFQGGKVDAISDDDTVLAGLAAQDPYAKIVGPPFTAEPYGLGIAQGHPEFVRFVNGVLERMRTDGTWKQLYAKWLSRLGPVTEAPKATYRN
jgi:polar amino acid transport system substrate-binding protein